MDGGALVTDIIINPGQDIQQLCKTAKPGDTIYLRGGLYRNIDWDKPFPNRTKGSLAQISLKGTSSAPITIKPYAGERVTIESDVTAFALKNCEWLNIEGIEFKGRGNEITLELARSLWWLTDCRLWQTGANGISINGCLHVNINDCVIHNWPGSGINENYSEYIFVRNSIIAHCARWSVGGVHGWANSKPGTGIRVNEDDVKMGAYGNLVIGTQQCIPSRVTAKGFADLGLDEGGGLHTQAQSTVTADGGVVWGKWEIIDNLIMFCGKSGINANGVGNLLIECNSLYQNVQNTVAADILISPPKESDLTYNAPPPVIRNNIVHSLPSGRSFHRFGDPGLRYTGIEDNYVLAGVPGNTGYETDPESNILELPAVFIDPVNGDFRRHGNVAQGAGASDQIVLRLTRKAAEYGIALAPCSIKTDDAYLAALKQYLFDTWPAPDQISTEFGPNFVLRDPVTGHEYNYGNRHLYPNDPN